MRQVTTPAKNMRIMTPVDMVAIQDPPFGAFIVCEEKKWVHAVEVILGIHVDQKLTKSDCRHPTRKATPQCGPPLVKLAT